ncbi:MAG TPA: hypothetical protein VHD37_01270 [Candidatus Paceibacterota bacterium]|nr:hypothetical protein [Candidatus Paceibacterota bacterium]
MAEHGGGSEDPMQLLVMVLGAMALLVFFWFASGAYKNADLRGIFIAPPAPIGPGGSYGPQIGHPSSLSPQQDDATNQ